MEPKIRRNIFLNAHADGLKKRMDAQRDSLKAAPRFKAPKHALIIGGSSGYGFASRLVLANQGTHTFSVSFEKAPENEKTGSAGYWNNTHFMNAFKNGHMDLNQDAFAASTKADVIAYYKERGVTIDLIIYSLAAGARPGADGELVRSALKPIGESYSGMHLDVASRKLSEITLEPASQKEIDDTVYVMGGSDFYDWVKTCDEAGILSDSVKAVTFSYVGGAITKPIYRDGALGKAKDDLEAVTYKLDHHLQVKGGEAIVARLKAIVTKASMFIPGIATYGGLLFDEMMARGVHETTLEHVERLFRENIYGTRRIYDSEGRVCLDTFELDPTIQDAVKARFESAREDILESKGMQAFIEEFYQINGFNV